MGFLLKTFVYVSVLVTIVAGVAFAFARRGNDVSKQIEKFVADQGK